VPNLQFELDQLTVADEHIAAAERNIADLSEHLARARAAGDETELAQRAVNAAKDGLRAFLEHRELIVKVIEDVRAGRLPNSDKPARTSR
jgi:hypothetical protein